MMSAEVKWSKSAWKAAVRRWKTGAGLRPIGLPKGSVKQPESEFSQQMTGWTGESCGIQAGPQQTEHSGGGRNLGCKHPCWGKMFCVESSLCVGNQDEIHLRP